MACCYSRSVLMAMYPETEGCKCCHFKRRRDRILRKKVAEDVFTTNTVPLPTDDVDELVSIIEGTRISKAKGNCTEAAKSAKKLKKERQREKKRLEEEAALREEEERLRAIEEARLKAEAEQQEELLRKRREKKKKQRMNKKSKSIEPKHNNAEEESFCVLSGLSLPCSSGTASKSADTYPSSKSEMVTIRRHSVAPDTTVTISVKNDTGAENLLYTLVNGQVYTDTKEAAMPPKSDLSPKAKPKGKKQAKIYIGTEGMNMVHGKEDSVHEDSTMKEDTDWFSSHVVTLTTNTNVRGGPSPSSAIPNGPRISSPCSLSSSNRNMGNSFSVFSDFDSSEIDLSTLKLPPGITITKVNQPMRGEGSASPEHVLPMPPPGAGHYNIDHNMIVMNPPDYDEVDEEYNSDDYMFHGNRRVSEFETVLSNKEKRKRSKANRCDDEGSGSKERPLSREPTPIITCGKIGGGKRGSDASMKSTSSNSNTDRRRNSGSGKSSDTRKKSDGKSSGTKKDQRPDSRRKGSEATSSRNVVKLTRDQPISNTSASPGTRMSNTPSPASMEPPRSLLKINPLKPLKMADVVSGIRKVSKDVDVVVIPEHAPPSSSPSRQGTAYLQEGQQGYDLKGHGSQCMNLGCGTSKVNDQSVKISQRLTDPKPSNSDPEYNMWTSVPRPLDVPSDKMKDSRPAGANTYTLFDDAQGFWKNPWTFEHERPAISRTPTSFDGRCHAQAPPSMSKPPGFSCTSSAAFPFNSKESPKFSFKGNGDMSSTSPTLNSNKPQSPFAPTGTPGSCPLGNYSRLVPKGPEPSSPDKYYKSGTSMMTSYPTSFNPGMTTMPLGMDYRNGTGTGTEKCWMSPPQPQTTRPSQNVLQPQQYSATHHPKIGNGFGTHMPQSNVGFSMESNLSTSIYKFQTPVPQHNAPPPLQRSINIPSQSAPTPAPSGAQYSLFGCTTDYEHW